MDRGQDPESQLLELRRHAAHFGWTITKEYIDHESGKTGDRDQLQAMLRDAMRRRFDTVLVWALDRLSREGIEKTFLYIRTLRDSRVDFISYSEPQFNTTGPAGELMLAIAAWIAQQERQRISERTRAGLARVKAAGQKLGRKEIVVDMERVAELKAEGLGVRLIAREMGLTKTVVHNAMRAAGLGGGVTVQPEPVSAPEAAVPEQTGVPGTDQNLPSESVEPAAGYSSPTAKETLLAPVTAPGPVRPPAILEDWR